ncbi:MAG: hypothetical protein DRJ01_02725 [Bacteroidetes bacterium]|nr:MAG: hypothetical protein DRJ01_02725 [Bacteroidota bacterium]
MSLTFFIAFNLFSQEEKGYLEVKGTAKSDRRVIKNAKIEIYRNFVKVKTITTDESGKFDFKLDLNRNYIVKFVKKGLVSKKVSFITVLPKDEIGIWTYRFSIDLFPMVEGLDISILENPIAKIKYNEVYGEFDFDEEYTEEMFKKIENLLNQYENLKEQAYQQTIAKADTLFDKKKYKEALEMYDLATNYNPYDEYPDEMIRQTKRIISKQESQKKSYDKAINMADKNFLVENYKQAKSYYKKALSFIPEANYPKTKINEIDKILGNIKANYDEKIINEKAYKEYIAYADKSFSEKHYLEAKDKYNKALDIKPNEQYPIYKLQEIEKIITAQQNKDANNAQKLKAYNEAIKQADLFFNNKKYSDAKINYKKALSYKPNEQYPQDKIDSINEILVKLKSIDEKYNKAIQFADNNFNLKYYEKAKQNYSNASLLKPDEEYPKNKIIEINKILISYNEKEKSYKEIIKNADLAFEKEQYEKSKSFYNKALSVKPEEEYPKSKLLKIDKILTQQNAVNLSYKSAIESANQEFNNKNYQSSLSYYQKALAIKPNEQYPKQRVSEIKIILADVQNKKNEYNKTVKEADNLFFEKEYNQSKMQYEKALKILPDENYPKQKINELIELIASAQREKKSRRELQKQYNEIISNADKFFNSKKYNVAKDLYNQAISILPKEQYPKTKINDINTILDNLKKEKIASYNKIIKIADNYFNNENYEQAKLMYNKALSLLSNKVYPKNQLTQILKILEQKKYEQQKQLMIDQDYKNAINEADKFYNSADYVSAKAKYKTALNIKPNQKYPQDRIEKINKIIQLQKEQKIAATEKERQQKIDEAKAGREKDFDFKGKEREIKFLSDLARKYPEGVTVEHYNKPQKKIKRVIVNRGGVAKEYLEVKYSYGTYYFRNGRNISRYIFLSETKE